MTSIGKGALKGCTSLESITIPFVGGAKNGTENTYLGYIFGASSYSSNSSYIPSSLKNVAVTGGTSIGSNDFYGCSGLTGITIPDSVTSIGRGAFESCTSLESITIPFVGGANDGTENTHFGYIFGASDYSQNASCVPSSLKTVIIIGGSNIGSSAFYACTGLTSVTISKSVISIGSSAFNGCSSLETIIIPNSVTSIGSSVFGDCTSLTSITIPSSVTSIDGTPFAGCSALESITVAKNNTKYHSDGNCLIETASKTLIAGCKNSVIPTDGSVTSIGYMTSMGYSAFSYCSGLTSITIPDSVTSIGPYAFSDCTGLTSVTIPDSVTSIGSGAFESCTFLESITIPFVGKTKDGTENTHFGYIFGAFSYSKNASYVPSSLKTVVITGGTSIHSYAFYDCRKLTSITIPNSVTSIGSSAFNNCSGLTSITIPDSVTFISDGAFMMCVRLETITVAEGNKRYHSSGNCLIESATKTLIWGGNNSVIPQDGSVTSIDPYAFWGIGLTSITIPNGVTDIGSSAFEWGSLQSITIPNSVTRIEANAFNACSDLTAINFNGTKAQWGAISKDSDWDCDTGNYTIYCTDGTISKS